MTQLIDFSNYKFRASGNGLLMPEPKAKKDKEAGNLSEGAKTHLIDVYVQAKYNRRTEISSKYIMKGNAVEEDSITLYSRVKKKFYKKNTTQLENEFFKGTRDSFEGESIEKASLIPDIKSSWDIYTFFRNHSKGLSDIYYWQMQTYMSLTGARFAKVAFCLVNTPETLVNDQKRRLAWQMNAGTSYESTLENQDFIEACNEIDRLSYYDDIPIEERVIEFFIERNDEDIQKLQNKVIKAREYLSLIDQMVNTGAADPTADLLKLISNESE